MKSSPRAQPRFKTFSLIVIFVTFGAFAWKGLIAWVDYREHTFYNKHFISSTVGRIIAEGAFPDQIEINHQGSPLTTQVSYTINNELQSMIESLFRQYRPDYGSFVAIDARSGKILTLVSYSGTDTNVGNLALQALFPAASIFKVVTAAAALDQKLVSTETVIPFNGRSGTLYKRNVETQIENRWTRYMPLREAFGKSVNTVFGKLGAFYIGPLLLNDYAQRFGFNTELPADLPVQWGTAPVASNDRWSLVETASGFTVRNTMSPLQGALIAAAIGNNGIMMEPYIVENLKLHDGRALYNSHPQVANVVVDPETATELKTLMKETVRTGTTRREFRTFLRSKKFQSIEIGGKTGSLTAHQPKGKCDWFIAYADDGTRLIALAALTVHQDFWRVKSAYLARRFIEHYFTGH